MKTTIEVENPMGQMAKYEGEDWLKIGEDILAAESRRNHDSYNAVIRCFDKMIHNESWQRDTGLEKIVIIVGSVLGYKFEKCVEGSSDEF